MRLRPLEVREVGPAPRLLVVLAGVERRRVLDPVLDDVFEAADQALKVGDRVGERNVDGFKGVRDKERWNG